MKKYEKQGGIKWYFKTWYKVKKYGIKFWFSQDYRRRCHNRKSSKRGQEVYGSGYKSRKKETKLKLFKIKGNKCFWCDKRMNFKTATIDHIIPVSQERNNTYSNLRLIHEECRAIRDNAIRNGLIINPKE